LLQPWERMNFPDVTRISLGCVVNVIIRHVNLFSDRLSYFLVVTLHDSHRMIPGFLMSTPGIHVCVCGVTLSVVRVCGVCLYVASSRSC
jgi:hypothetical protein